MVQVESRRTKVRTRAGNEKWGSESGLAAGRKRACPTAPQDPRAIGRFSSCLSRSKKMLCLDK